MNALRSLSELRYRNYPLGIEMIDIEDKIKSSLDKNLHLDPQDRRMKMELIRKERG